MTAESPIRAARIRAKLTQSQLASMVGTTKATVSGWEQGYGLPRPSTIAKLVDVLKPHLTLEALFKHIEAESSADAPKPTVVIESTDLEVAQIDCPNCNPSALRLAREKAGLTQTELGNRVKVDRSLISQYEIGMKVPRMKMATALVNALKPHLTLADLLSPQPKPIASGLAPSPRIFQAAFTRLMARAGIDWTTDSDPDTAMVRAACLRSDSESGTLS